MNPKRTLEEMRARKNDLQRIAYRQLVTGTKVIKYCKVCHDVEVTGNRFTCSECARTIRNEKRRKLDTLNVDRVCLWINCDNIIPAGSPSTKVYCCEKCGERARNYGHRKTAPAYINPGTGRDAQPRKCAYRGCDVIFTPNIHAPRDTRFCCKPHAKAEYKAAHVIVTPVTGGGVQPLRPTLLSEYELNVKIALICCADKEPDYDPRQCAKWFAEHGEMVSRWVRELA